jgi:hypothetical protein
MLFKGFRLYGTVFVLVYRVAQKKMIFFSKAIIKMNASADLNETHISWVHHK